MTDTNNCVAVKPVTIVNNPAPFASAPVCMVTVDPQSQFNIILWDKTPYTNVDSFIVYREIATNNYQPIARIPYASLSQFTDTARTMYFPNTGDPNTGTYRYKIQMHDTCGGYSSLSPYHNTIFFFNSSGIFTWPQLYTVEGGTNPVTSYVLMRDDNSNGNWQAVGSVSGTQQFISDPQYSFYQNTASWRVKTQWNITCTPTFRHTSNVTSTSYNSSLSNIYQSASVTNVSNYLSETALEIYPNPTEGKMTVYCPALKIRSIEFKNVIGELVRSFDNDETQHTIQIDISDFSKGIYFLSFQTSNGTVVKKLVKE